MEKIKSISRFVPAFFVVPLIVLGFVVFYQPLSAYAIGSSITINSVTLTLQNDANSNSIANIGDTIRVNLVVTNTDDGCSDPAGTTATVDLTKYGGTSTEALSCINDDNAGVLDVMRKDFVVTNAGESGIDVGASSASSQVNVVTSDLNDLPGPNQNSNSMAQSVDTIAPTVTTESISVSGATGVEGVFKAGDVPVLQWDPESEGDTIASVVINASDFRSSDTGRSAALDEGVYKASLSGALDSQSDSENNISVTVTDDAGNSTTTAGTNDYVVDTILPTLLSAQITGGNTIKLVYSESVTGSSEDYTDLRIIGEESTRNVTGYAGNGTNIITPSFS